MLPCLLLHQFHCQLRGSSLNRAIVLLVSLDSNQPSIPSSKDPENGGMSMVDLHFSQHVPGESLSHAYDWPWIPRGSHEQALQVTHVPPHYGIEHFGISKWWKEAELSSPGRYPDDGFKMVQVQTQLKGTDVKIFEPSETRIQPG